MGEHGNKCLFCFVSIYLCIFFKALVVTNVSSMALRMDVGGTSCSPSGGCLSSCSIVLQDMMSQLGYPGKGHISLLEL